MVVLLFNTRLVVFRFSYFLFVLQQSLLWQCFWTQCATQLHSVCHDTKTKCENLSLRVVGWGVDWAWLYPVLRGRWAMMLRHINLHFTFLVTYWVHSTLRNKCVKTVSVRWCLWITVCRLSSLFSTVKPWQIIVVCVYGSVRKWW